MAARTIDSSPRALARPRPTLRQSLRAWDGLIVFLAITIGAGIYSVPQRVAQYYPSFSVVVWLWIAAAVIVLTGCLTYSELGTRLPITGGDYVYLSRAYGKPLGFVCGWTSFFITAPNSRAGLALVTADYCGHFFELSRTAHLVVALGFIGLVAFVNIIGVHWALAFQRTTVAVKVGGLLVLIGAAFLFFGDHPSRLGLPFVADGNTDPLAGLASSMLLIIFAFSGWQRVGVVAEEMYSPRKTIPRGLLGGMAVLTVLFLTMNFLYYRFLGAEGVRSSPVVASDLARTLLGAPGGAVIALLVIVSTTSSMSVSMMATPRMYYQMAKDGLFFRWFAVLHPVFRTPVRSTLVHTAVCCIVLVMKANFTELITSYIFMNLLISVLKAASIFTHRARETGGAGVYRVPLYPFVPAIYVLTILALLVMRVVYDWQNACRDLGILGVGIVLAVIWCRRYGTRDENLNAGR